MKLSEREQANPSSVPPWPLIQVLETSSSKIYLCVVCKQLHLSWKRRSSPYLSSLCFVTKARDCSLLRRQVSLTLAFPRKLIISASFCLLKDSGHDPTSVHVRTSCWLLGYRRNIRKTECCLLPECLQISKYFTDWEFLKINILPKHDYSLPPPVKPFNYYDLTSSHYTFM